MLRLLTVLLMVTLLASPAIFAEEQVEARKELEMLGIPFTADQFVNSAKRGDLPAIDLMLDAGMPVDTKDEDGMPALFAAVSARIEVRDLGGGAVLFEITSGPIKWQTIQIPGVNRKPLHNAVVFALLDRGGDPNVSDGRGATAIMKAARMGNEVVVKALLGKGADVNAKNSDGEMALILAVEHNHGPIVRLLIENGADINARNTAGLSALKTATANGHTHIVKLLLEGGAESKFEDLAKSTEESTSPDPELTPMDIRIKALENAVTILRSEDAAKQSKIHALQNQVQKLDAEVAELKRPRGAEFLSSSR